MRPDQWHGVGAHGRDGGGPIAEPEGEMLLTIDQAVEAEYAGRGGVAVGEPQGHRDLGADRRSGQGQRHRGFVAQSV